MKLLVYLLCCLAVALTYGQTQQTDIFDEVETVKLSDEISSMGRLGGIAVDKLGYIYVANFRDKVWKISPQGKVELFADGLYGASGNAMDEKGNLIQSNFYSNSVVSIDRGGNVSVLAEKNIVGPVGVGTDGKGNIYVCNCSGNSIAKITSDGNSSIFSTSDLFNCPNGITTGPNGNFYVTNYSNDIIVKITPEGTASKFTTVKGGEGNAHIVYMNGNYYVTKIKANALYRVTPDGKNFLVAGRPGVVGLEDGPAGTSSLSRPNGIAKDPYGSTLYINNLQGPWVINKIGDPTSIVIRKVDIKTVTEIFDQTLEAEGLDAAVKAYWNYKNDPTHQHEDTGVETGTYAWQLMIKQKVPEAIRVFTLMTETYPERWRPYYYLGEVYKIIGQYDKAKDYYKQSLKKYPKNQLVETKLRELGG